ncbi:MAG: beta-N-acetylhexosaminidase [Bacteroidetes bacterium]|nr:MAG: beta-N-acetylhexosaminidase [Bacteroidota bacterium]
MTQRQFSTLLITINFLLFLIGNAQQINIIPKPVEVNVPSPGGQFTIDKNTPIILDGAGLENSANFLNDYLSQVYGFKLNVSHGATAPNSIHLGLAKMGYKIPGAYTLQVKNNGITINGDNENGTFYGMQSLIQLLPVDVSTSLKVPYVSIKDYPRFEYRGMHLDVGRHFFPVSFVKKYIDYIALHKMNYFHWHLTEDQGWRIEIKKYPKLTEVGAYRAGTIIGRYPGKGNDSIRYGGFYTQEEIRDVVAYAAARYVNVVPEIEMPGHACGALAAYPQLGCTGGPYKVKETWGVFDDVFCAGNDEVFSFLQDVIDEVIPLFPCKYIHVGGDECPKTQWKKCPKCQQRIKDNHLKDEHELQSYFIQRMEKYINSKGKTLIGWDEILEGGLAPNAVVMSWRGEQGGIAAAKQNHDVIMTPTTYVYFDYSQSKNEDSITIGHYLPVEKIYNYEPITAELDENQGKHILGGQANVWSEYMAYPSKVEYMIFPRMTAFSEVLWSPKGSKDYPDFQKRLAVQFKRYELWKSSYSKAFFDLKASILPTKDNSGVLWKLESNDKDAIVEYSVGVNNRSRDYAEPIKVTSSDVYFGYLTKSNKRVGSVAQNFSFNLATGNKVYIENPTVEEYQGQGGAFGLVNGAISDKVLGSSEWLGWAGTDMVAFLDLGVEHNIGKVACHVAKANGSRCYLPQFIEVYASEDGRAYSFVTKSSEYAEDSPGMGWMTARISGTTTRYLKIVAKNIGKIPEGFRSAGEPAMLFVDELEVETP